MSASTFFFHYDLVGNLTARQMPNLREDDSPLLRFFRRDRRNEVHRAQRPSETCA